jgi:inward rectifier potassium channel
MANEQVDDIVVVGATRHPLRDAYHLLLTASWPQCIGIIAAAFLVVNAMFATAFVATGGVAGARPGSFADAFFFSAQTLGTIGYGAMYPMSTGANMIVVVESLVGVLFAALSTGIVFARFSRSTEAMVFARRPCISPMDGKPTLMVRIGNDREGAIVEALVRISFVKTERTKEGVTIYRMRDLTLVRERTQALARTWNVMHVIEADSPLFGATPESCEQEEVELIVTVFGTDGTSLQPVHGRHRYLARDLLWGARPCDVLSDLPDGRLQLDVRRFHDVVPTDPTSSFPYPAKETAKP